MNGFAVLDDQGDDAGSVLGGDFRLHGGGDFVESGGSRFGCFLGNESRAEENER